MAATQTSIHPSPTGAGRKDALFQPPLVDPLVGVGTIGLELGAGLHHTRVPGSAELSWAQSECRAGGDIDNIVDIVLHPEHCSHHNLSWR